MTIKQQGGIFGRNPTFNDVDVEGTLTVTGASSTAALSATTGTFNTVYASTSVAVGAAANYQATFYKAGANANYVQVSNGMLGAGAGNGILYGVDASGNGVLNKQGTGDLITTVAGIERLRILQAGTLDVSAANIAFDNGYGIDFSATSGTGTSELFDDYEEGTWTPVIADASSGGNTASITVVGAKYIKIGKIVHLYARINNINTSGMTSGNAVSIQGLPFTSGVDVFSCGSCVLDRIGAGGDTTINPKIDESSSFMQLAVTSSANGTSDANLLVSQIGSTGSDIHSLQITYEAS